jgi:hypothetical protein
VCSCNQLTVSSDHVFDGRRFTGAGENLTAKCRAGESEVVHALLHDDVSDTWHGKYVTLEPSKCAAAQ